MAKRWRTRVNLLENLILTEVNARPRQKELQFIILRLLGGPFGQDFRDCKRFKPRSTSTSSSVIVWIRVVMKRTVVGVWQVPISSVEVIFRVK